MDMGERKPYKENEGPDDLDRALDAALAKYSSVEPRKGLDQRVMANLKAQPAGVPAHVSWRWGLALALVLLLFVAGLAWNSRKVSHPVMVRQEPTSVPGTNARAAEGSGLEHQPAQVLKAPIVEAVVHKKRKRDPGVRLGLTSVPKRQQFPSPQPLSEQEKLLASYVAQYPERAILTARAQADFEKQDREEDVNTANGGSKQDPKQISQ